MHKELLQPKLILLSSLLIFLIAFFGDYCVMSHIECCIDKDLLDFQHNVVCKHDTDPKCTKLFQTVQNIEAMELYIVENAHQNSTKTRMSNIYMENTSNVWFAKTEGHFTRFYQTKSIHNQPSTYDINLNPDVYQSIFIFKGYDKAYVGFVTVHNNEMFILIK